MRQSMLGTYCHDYGLLIQSTHWYIIWVGHNCPSDITYYSSTSHSIWITTFLGFIPISGNPSVVGFMHPYYLFWISLMVGGPFLLLPVLIVLLSTIILMHFPHHFTSNIMYTCCIVTACHTTILSLLYNSILQLGDDIVRLDTFVPHDIHWPIIKIICTVHCNHKLQ